MILVQRIAVIFFLIWTLIAITFASQIFVSTTGDDNTGIIDRIDLPFKTIPKAISLAVHGDTIYVRGGVYTYSGSSTAITLPSMTGASATSRCYLFSYPAERALLDFSSMTGTSADGIKINGSYWYLKGLDLKGAPHNGLKISGGNYNVVEFCTSFENRNTGVQLAAGASYNRFINCDSYYNADVSYGNADGFAPKLDVGTGNYFYGCRAWQNSDDGWDGYLRPSDDVTDTLENCWSFMNGYLKNGTMQTGNGNGFKMGGGDQDSSKTISNVDSLRHDMILKNCLSFDNKAKGFDQNNNRGSITLYNCTGYRNGSYNFSIPGFIRVGDTLSVKNCISFPSSSITLSGVPNPILATNNWIAPFTAVDSSDFISIDTTGVRGPRKADGSLPDITFMHLAKGSQFIDAGTDVGLPYNGTRPDLGCFESDYPTGIKENNVRITNFQLLQNYPNPFNPSTKITYQVKNFGMVLLNIYDVLGREVVTLVNEPKSSGIYSIVWNSVQMPSGIYFSRLVSNGEQQIRKMILIK